MAGNKPKCGWGFIDMVRAQNIQIDGFDNFWVRVSNCCSILLFYSYFLFSPSISRIVVAGNLCRRLFSWWILRLALLWHYARVVTVTSCLSLTIGVKKHSRWFFLLPSRDWNCNWCFIQVHPSRLLIKCIALFWTMTWILLLVKGSYHTTSTYSCVYIDLCKPVA